MHYCEICGKHNAQRHHLFTRGAWGEAAEVAVNIVYLCWPHHMAWHDLGRYTAARVYGMEDRLNLAEQAVRYPDGG
jgi:hypothetical protein